MAEWVRVFLYLFKGSQARPVFGPFLIAGGGGNEPPFLNHCGVSVGDTSTMLLRGTWIQ